MKAIAGKMPAVALAVPVFFLGASLMDVCANADETGQVIQITAKRYEYNPVTITVKKGVPVVLEFTSLDRLHGFSCPGNGWN